MSDNVKLVTAIIVFSIVCSYTGYKQGQLDCGLEYLKELNEDTVSISYVNDQSSIAAEAAFQQAAAADQVIWDELARMRSTDSYLWTELMEQLHLVRGAVQMSMDAYSIIETSAIDPETGAWISFKQEIEEDR